jgi:hypothetical protein
MVLLIWTMLVILALPALALRCWVLPLLILLLLLVRLLLLLLLLVRLLLLLLLVRLLLLRLLVQLLLLRLLVQLLLLLLLVRLLLLLLLVQLLLLRLLVQLLLLLLLLLRVRLLTLELLLAWRWRDIEPLIALSDYGVAGLVPVIVLLKRSLTINLSGIPIARIVFLISRQRGRPRSGAAVPRIPA